MKWSSRFVPGVVIAVSFWVSGCAGELGPVEGDQAEVSTAAQSQKPKKRWPHFPVTDAGTGGGTATTGGGTGSTGGGVASTGGGTGATGGGTGSTGGGSATTGGGTGSTGGGTATTGGGTGSTGGGTATTGGGTGSTGGGTATTGGGTGSTGGGTATTGGGTGTGGGVASTGGGTGSTGGGTATTGGGTGTGGGVASTGGGTGSTGGGSATTGGGTGTTGGGTGTVITPGDPGTSDVLFTVDSTADVKPISRYIYGKNFNGRTWAQEPNLTLNRIGGNRWSAYNWENNASNAGSDYNYQSDGYLGGGSTPGEAVRLHVANARAAGGSILVTVPMLGWVAADKLGTSVLGQSISSRFIPTRAVKGSALVYPPSLTDNLVAQDEFVSWLESQFPTAHQDPARELFYSLDNEPDLWSDTHSSIHPSPVTYAELLQKTIDHSAMIKSLSPAAKVFGFVSYGWYGFLTLQDAPDAAGRDFTTWFLDNMRAAGTSRGRRLLDVLDLHWYPEARGGTVRITGDDTSATVAAARMQAPRSLWDPSYVESSWITSSNGNQPIRLIPDMQAKIAAHYPGTNLAFTEYSYGGGAHISGGIAQADVLGIFGREGAFAANFWPLSSNYSFISSAFAMYRSYDGAGGHFGDTSVRALNPEPANYSVYASVDAGDPSRMVLVLINKSSSARTAGLKVTHTTRFNRAEVYQLTSGGPTIVRASDLALTAPNAVRYTMPAYSVTTLVLRP